MQKHHGVRASLQETALHGVAMRLSVPKDTRQASHISQKIGQRQESTRQPFRWPCRNFKQRSGEHTWTCMCLEEHTQVHSKYSCAYMYTAQGMHRRPPRRQTSPLHQKSQRANVLSRQNWLYSCTWISHYAYACNLLARL